MANQMHTQNRRPRRGDLATAVAAIALLVGVYGGAAAMAVRHAVASAAAPQAAVTLPSREHVKPSLPAEWARSPAGRSEWSATAGAPPVGGGLSREGDNAARLAWLPPDDVMMRRAEDDGAAMATSGQYARPYGPYGPYGDGQRLDSPARLLEEGRRPGTAPELGSIPGREAERSASAAPGDPAFGTQEAQAPERASPAGPAAGPNGPKGPKEMAEAPPGSGTVTVSQSPSGRVTIHLSQRPRGGQGAEAGGAAAGTPGRATSDPGEASGEGSTEGRDDVGDLTEGRGTADGPLAPKALPAPEASALASPDRVPEVSGRWQVTNTVNADSHPAWRGYRLTYRIALLRSGDRIVGDGVKWAENGHPLPAGQRSSIHVTGELVGNELRLHFSEQEAPYPDRRLIGDGQFLWRVFDSGRGLGGTFTSSTASLHGISNAVRLR